MADGVCRVGDVDIRLEGGDGGIAGWVLRDALSIEVDGLPTEAEAGPPSLAELAARHPNTAIGVDHIVVFTPDLKRTVAGMEGAGFNLRRVREATEPGPDVRQAFFRPGGAIVEVVENPHGKAGPAAFWGITLAVADIDRCAELLGDRMGEPRGAVQQGRRIATIRREAGLGIPVALITPHTA